MGSSSGLSIRGDVSACEDVTIDFALEGSIDATGHRLVIPDGASVQATVIAAAVIVHGRLDGRISAERVDLAPTACVTGSIVSPRFAVRDGAQFTGMVNTDRAQAALNVARHRQKTASEGSR